MELMRICIAVAALFALSAGGASQNPPKAPAQVKTVTVPATIDHNRVIIDVYVPAAKGITERVHAWIDTGNPELFESERVASVHGWGSSCSAACSAPAPTGVVVGDMEVSFDGVKHADSPNPASLNGVGTPLILEGAAAVLIPGVKAEINLPSTVLRHHDVLIDFPGRKVTIGTPGSIHFNGISAKVQINPDTGVITVPSKIDNKKYDLELDLGSPMSSLSANLFDALAAAHPDWPHMTGAVGPASNFRLDQMTTRLMRLDRLQFGPLFLTNVAVLPLPNDPPNDRMEEVPGILENVAGAGLLGTEALQNYRVGIDYAHSTVYFDLGRTYMFPDFDVIGLILSAEWDGQFKILGVADIDGKPSVPVGTEGVQPGDHLIAVDEISVRDASLGQVWSMLGGTPGQERTLTIERQGKTLTVIAKVQHFLAEAPDSDADKKKSKR
jgi:hypothetical protein